MRDTELMLAIVAISPSNNVYINARKDGMRLVTL